MSSKMSCSSSKECIGELQIVISTISFSCAFVGQRYAMLDNKIGPVTFNAARYIASLFFLVLLQPILRHYSNIDIHHEDGAYIDRNGGNKSLLYWIGVAGLSNFGGSMLQQYSLVYLDAAKVAFITGSYVVVIPFVEWLLPAAFGHIPSCVSIRIWIGVIVCVVGLYYISGCTDSSVSCLDSDSTQVMATFAVMGSVLFWTVNLMMADLASKQVDCLHLTMGEFGIVIVLTIIAAIYLEPEQWVYPFPAVTQNLGIIIIVGCFEGFAYIFSTIGQMYVRPSRASILYSAGEAMFTCIGGYLILNEILSPSELFGGVLMIVAAIISGTNPEEDAAFEEESKLLYDHDNMFELTYKTDIIPIRIEKV